MKWFLLLIKFIFYIPFRLIFPCKIIGKSNIPKNKTYITVTNHLSAIDAILLVLYLSGFRYFLAKKELDKNRFVSFILKMLGAVYIDRQGLDLKGIKTCIAGLKKHPLAIFPEGTRNHTDENLQAVKGGAAMIAVKADTDIYPVMIHHRTKAFRRNYIFVGQKINLPFAKGDRFNSEAMSICTAIVNDSMNENKQLLDNLVAEKRWKEYNNEVRRLNKERKSAAKIMENQ